MESKDWSGFGYLSPDFSPGMPVSQRIWTPPVLQAFLSMFVSITIQHSSAISFQFFRIYYSESYSEQTTPFELLKLLQ